MGSKIAYVAKKTKGVYLIIELIASPMFHPSKEETDIAKEDQLQGSEGAKLVEFAGRKCYDSLGSGRNSNDYHKHIIDVGHGSVLEHAQYTFLIKGVSRSLTHELVRHRVGVAISQRSTRYVDESKSIVIDHPLIEEFISCEMRDSLHHVQEQSREMYKIVFNNIEQGLIKRGVDKTTAKKQARGAARQYLENGLETELVWSANIRSLRHVINMRGSVHADGEIRQLAMGLYDIMSIVCPEYFSDGTKGETPDGIGSVSIKPI